MLHIVILLGSLIVMVSMCTRILILIAGYIYPTCKCFQAIEMDVLDVDKLLIWCQYWVIIALINVTERIVDPLISWVPLYGEIKLAFIIYLWHPKTQGTTYVYNTYLKPHLSKNIMDIDEKFKLAQTWVEGMLSMHWRRIHTLGHTKFLEVVNFLSLQSLHES
ncbi:hypothetical protein GOP47_0003135 [Adiantum capillus-veneris]|uniref:HVA22-like protein n=1 Tax=Adiantum capillus-veneris TaxID=13818 RepID=A0A9D4ZRZ1_ADICA|nr:hypothetical protein GOP47_0003135 [Adiantum capillus-veneris]